MRPGFEQRVHKALDGSRGFISGGDASLPSAPRPQIQPEVAATRRGSGAKSFSASEWAFWMEWRVCRHEDREEGPEEGQVK
jgi:hypothetical protein